MAPPKCCRVIGACAILHNIALRRKEPLVDDDGNVPAPQPVDVPAFNGRQDGGAVREHIARSFFAWRSSRPSVLINQTCTFLLLLCALFHIFFPYWYQFQVEKHRLYLSRGYSSFICNRKKNTNWVSVPHRHDPYCFYLFEGVDEANRIQNNGQKNNE